MGKRSLHHKYLWGLILVSAGALASSFDESFPGEEPSRRVLRTQEKVDSLFDKGSYERAMFIYREELAPLGDKYAQYMVGYMYLTGKGVEQNVVTASAWYRLASERGNKQFAAARDDVMKILNAEQRAASDGQYEELHGKLSDVSLTMAQIREDLETLRHYTRDKSIVARSYYERFNEHRQTYAPVVERLVETLDRLIDISLSQEFGFAQEQFDIDALETEVRQEVAIFEESRN